MGRLKRILAVIGLVVLLFTAAVPVNAAWWDTDWLYRRTITIDNADIAENLLDFPVGVFLDNSNFDFSQAQPDGDDIRFVDDDEATDLDHEVVRWNYTDDGIDNDSAEIWVEVPQIDASSDTDFIIMYWGNSTCANGENVAGTWNAGYAAVYHMNDNPANSAQILESTSSGNTGNKGGAYASTAANLNNGTGTLATNPTSIASGNDGTTVTVTGAGTFTITIPTNQRLIVTKVSVTSVTIDSQVAGNRTITVVGTGTFTATWSATDAPVEVEGLIGKAQYFNGMGQWINSTVAVLTPDEFTAEAVFMRVGDSGGTSGDAYHSLVDGLAGWQNYNRVSVNKAATYVYGTVTIDGTRYIPPVQAISPTEYNYVGTQFYDGRGRNIANGVLGSWTTQQGTLGTNTQRICIGNVTSNPNNYYYSNGYIDELRISSVARSAGWIAATNKSLRDTLVSYGAVSGKPLPPTNLTATASGNNIILDWTKGYLADDTIIIRGANSYPVSLLDGIEIYDGNGITFEDIGANDESQQVYYSAFSRSEWGYSDTYSTIWAGGESLYFIAFVVLALGLTISGFALRKSVLGVMAGGVWALTSFMAFTLSAASSPTNITDVYMGLFWLGIIFVIVCIFEAVYMRPKNEIGEEAALDMTEEQSLESDLAAVEREIYIPGSKSRRRKLLK